MAVNNIHFTKIEIEIVKYLFKHYKDKYKARQLAKILKINHTHTNKLCNLLTDKKLLVKEEIGSSIFFSYDYNNKLAIKFIGYIISLEESEFPKWLQVLFHSLKKFKNCIEMGIVFGSSIKNKDFSDIDVLLMYSPEKSRDVKRIKDGVRRSELVEKPIRYIDITEKDVIFNKEDKVFYNILSDNLVFHNPEKYVEVIRKCHK